MMWLRRYDKMAGKMLLGILPAKNGIEEEERLCDSFFWRGFSSLILCLLLLYLFQLAERVESPLTNLIGEREGVSNAWLRCCLSLSHSCC